MMSLLTKGLYPPNPLAFLSHGLYATLDEVPVLAPPTILVGGVRASDPSYDPTISSSTISASTDNDPQIQEAESQPTVAGPVITNASEI